MTDQTPANTPLSLDIFAYISDMIAPTTDQSRLVEAAIKVVLELLRAENCSVMLLNQDATALQMIGSSVIPRAQWPSITATVGQGVAGKVAESGRPMLVTKSDSKVGTSESSRTYKAESYISIPLQTARKQTTIGVLNVTDRVDQTALDKTDLQVVQAVGKLIASAIDSHQIWLQTHEARQHLSHVMNDLPIGMFTISSTGRLSLCNRAARHYLNLADIEIDRPWRECFPGILAMHVQNALSSLGDDGSTYTVEFVLPGNTEGDGQRSVRMSALAAAELTSLGANHLLFLIEDLQQMQELVELRRSDEMKSNFLSLISHELRTPLAAIKGAIHLLNQSAPPEMREKAGNIFRILHRNSDRLSRLVDNILGVMDLEAGSLRLYLKRTDIHVLVDRVITKYQTAATEKSVVWHIDLDAPKHELHIDEIRMGQVFGHLVENAVKFVNEGGEITVRSEEVDGNWRLLVANTGREIEPDVRDKIFSKFYQVDETLTREIGGTGLGLYISREIVKRHKGNIHLEQDFAGGACFLVYLPEELENAENAGPAPEPDAGN